MVVGFWVYQLLLHMIIPGYVKETINEFFSKKEKQTNTKQKHSISLDFQAFQMEEEKSTKSMVLPLIS